MLNSEWAEKYLHKVVFWSEQYPKYEQRMEYIADAVYYWLNTEQAFELVSKSDY